MSNMDAASRTKTSCAPEHVIWIKSVEKKLGIIKDNPSTYFSIYKVPTKLRQLREHAYTPSTVSIGPFHHGRSDLHAMEEHKLRYMLSFLQRTPDGQGPPTLIECAEALQGLEQEARRYYAENIGPFHHSRSDVLAMDQKNWRCMLSLLHQALNPRKNSDECAISESEENTGKYYADQHTNCNKFLEILLVDGCFILELLLRCCDKNFKDENDPITSNAWMVPAIRPDLALLENQIPFVVLQKLFDIVRSKCTPTDRLASACSCSLPEFAMHFFQPLLNTDKYPSISKELFQADRHFLGMLHKFYLPNNPVSPTKRPEEKKAWGFRHCATELSEAGIEFEKGTQGGLLDIITSSKGVVEIPPFSIDETLDSLLRNLIAFEQCSFRTTHHISSYVLLMSKLIQSSNDIRYLKRKGIITNIPGKAEDASTFFSSMCNGVVFREFYFTRLCEQVDADTKYLWHYHRIKALLLLKCRRYLFELIRDYFSNPWRAASTFAAVVLLVLTLLQTIYTMRA